jgi:hypothetical protein
VPEIITAKSLAEQRDSHCACQNIEISEISLTLHPFFRALDGLRVPLIYRDNIVRIWAP